MYGKLALNAFIVLMLLTSSIILFAPAGAEDEIFVDDEPAEGILEIEEEKIWDIHELADLGAATIQTYDATSIEEFMARRYNEWSMKWSPSPSRGPEAGAGDKDENDALDNATWVYDGDEIVNNVTSWIGGNSLHPSDVDFYMVNLTIYSSTNQVDKLILDIFSEDAENKNATLATNFYYRDYLFDQYTNLDFEATGKFHGNHSRFVYIPKVDPNHLAVVPIAFRFMSWNSTKIDYSFKVTLEKVSRSNWNGEYSSGQFVNRTIKPANMQKVNISHDFMNWYDLTAAITDEGLQTARDDHVRMSLRVDVATEERGQMYGYAGPALYNVKVNTTTIASVYFLWFNYSSQQVSVATVGGGNLPFVGILFGNDPINVGFNAQVSQAWLGISPLQLWLAGGQAFLGAEGNAEVQYNITNIAVQIIPPNDPPSLVKNIPDLTFDEDTGPWEDVLDLEEFFTDDWSDGDLRFDVKAEGNPPSQLVVEVAPDGRHLRVEVTEDNWFTAAPVSFKVRAYDWGVDWKKDSGDDAMTPSNIFKVTILPVNDDAYIEKVDTLTGSAVNNHDWITFQITQAQSIRSKKIYGRDNDTADKNSLVYTHNATTPAFKLYTNGQFDFIPTNYDVGTSWIKVTIDDGHPPHEDDYCLLKFIVTNINDPPVLVSLRNMDTGDTVDLKTNTEARFYNVMEKREVNITAEAYDPDISIGQPDTLTWMLGSIGWKAARHSTDPHKAYITYTPTNDDAIMGEARSTLFVMDAQKTQSKQVDIVLYVENVNDPPTILRINGEPVINGAVTLDAENGKNGFEAELFIITVEAEDIDPRDAVKFSINDPAFTEIPDPEDDFTTTFSFLPTQDHVGIHQLIITVSDKKDKKDSVRVNYEIVNVNDPPVEPRIDMSAIGGFKVGSEIEFRSRDHFDPDGDELTFIWNFGDGSDPVHGENARHTYQWPMSFIVTLTVQDPYGAEGVAKKTIIIAPSEDEVDPNLDSDGDGIPDWYEDQYQGFDKFKNDSYLDFDGDGFTNLEEYLAQTNPLDKNDHPPYSVQDKGDDMLIILLIVVVVGIILTVIVVLFALLLRSPKQVQQPMMYAPEPQKQLPPTPKPQPQLPPQPKVAPPPPPEEDLLAGFVEEAEKELTEEAKKDEEEENVWRPPEQKQEEEHHSQVDDLFADDYTISESK